MHTYTISPSIHCSMGSAPVGTQCPLTSSLGEFLGYRDWLWLWLLPVSVSIALPFAFHISVFSIHSSSPPIGFHSSIFHSGGICTPLPVNPPPNIQDLGLEVWNYGKWISEKVGDTMVVELYMYIGVYYRRYPVL